MSPQHGSNWVTLRVFYHDPQKDHLMREGLRPPLEDLVREGLVQGYFLRRNWHHGPHVRANLRLGDEQHLAQVQRRLEEALARYFAAHPSPTSLTPDTYLERYGTLAGLELIDEPMLPLFENHTLLWSPLLLRERRYGSPAVVRVAKDFMLCSQPFVDWLLEHDPPNARLEAFARLMFGFTAAFEGKSEPRFASPPSVAVSFRSHAIAFYHNLPEGEALERRFQALARRLQPHLDRWFDQALRHEPAEVGRWAELLAQTYDRLWRVMQEGEFWIPWQEEYEAEAQALPEGVSLPPLSASPDHQGQHVRGSELYRLQREPEIQVRRLLVNLMYECLLAAGCRPLDRLLLCELVASTVHARYPDKEAWWPRARGTGLEVRP